MHHSALYDRLSLQNCQLNMKVGDLFRSKRISRSTFKTLKHYSIWKTRFQLYGFNTIKVGNNTDSPSHLSNILQNI